MFYLFNGQLKEEQDKVSVSPMGEGYKYGLGLFETMLVSDGEIEFFKEHMDRLYKSCKVLGITFRVHRDELKSGIDDLIRMNHMLNASVKVQISKTPMGADSWIVMDVLKNRPNTFRVKVSDWIKGSSNPMICHKTTQYGGNLVELNKAKEEGFDEVLFFNELGYLTEGTFTNVFLIKQGKLFTPKVENGLLNGIMRTKIIKAAKALDIACIETDITRTDMEEMTSGFLTNSLIGVKAIEGIGDIVLDVQELQTWLLHRVKG